MPKEGISIYFSIKDGSSQVLKQIADKTRALDKDTQELQQTTLALEKANKNLLKRQGELNSQLKSSGKAVNEAQKAFDRYGDELSKARLDSAIEEHAKLKSELTEVNAQLQGNTKTYKEYLETIRKGGRSSESADGISGIGKKLGSMGWGLMSSGVGQLVSNSASGFIQALASSEIGTPAASTLSDTLGGAISGAMAGAVAGLPGIIAGGIVGTIAGGINSYTKIFEAKDDAFKDYYKTLYEEAGARTEQSITSGSALAGSREQDAISFSTLFGDRGKADAYLESMVDMANRTPFLYDDLKAMSKTLATYGWDDTNMLPVLQKIGDAGAALGMATGDMSAVATALGRMRSSDKASLEYLNILNDRGIGAVGYLAEAKGVSVGDMYSMISKNQISGTEAVDILLEALERDFSGSMLEQSKTFSGLSSTLEGLMNEIDNAGGEGYNEEKGKGIQADIDAYGGALGDALGYVNAVAGQTQARMENLEAQYKREALSAVLLGDYDRGLFTEEEKQQLEAWRQDYREAVKTLNDTAGEGEDGLRAGKQVEDLKERAETLAQAAFDSSDVSQTLQETEQEQIAAIRDSITATNDLAGALRSYETNQEFSKGMGAGSLLGGGAEGNEAGASLMAYTGTGRSAMPGSGGSFRIPDYVSRASGQRVVPYDNFPILAHQGERLLTAGEAREQDAATADGGGIKITVTGNSFQGTGEEMADQVAGLLLERLRLARMRG